MNYFKHLPTISYGDAIAKNLMARARFTTNSRLNKTVYYPYTTDDSDRIDLLSERYYNRPDLGWLVWFANDIVDPYYDMSLPPADFAAYIQKKYGSEAKARRQVKYYRNNWVNSEERLTISQFESLPAKHKKYYDPVLTDMLQVHSYKRNQEDWIRSTNKVLQVVLTAPSIVKVGDEIRQGAANFATISFVDPTDPTILTVQHVFGTLTAGAFTSNFANGTIASVTTISVCIPDDEASFWRSVRAYDYEDELNSSKKEIKLLDSRSAPEAEMALKRLMNSR